MSGFCVLSLAVFCVATVVLMPFVAFDSNPILTKIKMEAILPQDTDFSVSCSSIASLFIFVRIGFEPCNNHNLAAFVLPGPAICLLWQDVVLLITVIFLLLITVIFLLILSLAL